MPLVRVQMRSEYGRGNPELYREADREDPKAVLDGVAVAGLVGIIRQLGDLAEFAAEVFHGLQKQAMYTSSRSHKLLVRLQRMESALTPLEKAILAQKSHLHFAYTTGSVWHPRLQNEQNHFIVGDLPHIIMDSYEECRDPPCLQLLDKFDTGGPGSCLKRYSDPTFFRRASASSGGANVGKTRKARRRKKSRTQERNGASHGSALSNHSDRKDDDHASSSQTVSVGDETNSFYSRTGSNFHPAYSNRLDENKPKESFFSRSRMNHNDTIDSSSVDEHRRVVDDDFSQSLSQEKMGPRNVHQMDFQLTNEDTPTSVSSPNQIDEIETEEENYVDALNTIESESEDESQNQLFLGIISSPSSPPLQHIKISFPIMSEFESLKLKSKFRDGNFCQDLLPEFQLASEQSTPQHTTGSDSDNCLSHHSASNSEWESDDTPILSSLNPLFEQEMKIGSDRKDSPNLYLSKEPTPQPPPLNSDYVSETFNNAFERMSLGSTISPQFKPREARQHQSSDETIVFAPKSKWQKEARNGKGIDEKEDFLHQIRSKVHQSMFLQFWA